MKTSLHVPTMHSKIIHNSFQNKMKKAPPTQNLSQNTVYIYGSADLHSHGPTGKLGNVDDRSPSQENKLDICSQDPLPYKTKHIWKLFHEKIFYSLYIS